MSPVFPAVAALAAAAACAGCAPVEDEAALPANVSAERQCFIVSRISGYGEAPDGPGGTERLYVEVGASERWLLETFGACPELDWTYRIALDPRPYTSLCTGRTAEVLVPAAQAGRVDRCTARVLGKVTEP